VIPDLVARGVDLLRQIRVRFDPLSQHEEGGSDLSAPEDIQDFARVSRIGAVIEGQGNQTSGRLRSTMTLPERRNVREPAGTGSDEQQEEEECESVQHRLRHLVIPEA
jgi:hypothetical protein